MTNAEYLLRFHKFQKSREAFFAPKINDALKKQYKQFTKNISLGLNALDHINSTPLVRIIRNLYMDAGIVYGAKVRADFVKAGLIKRSVKQFELAGDQEVKNRRPIGFSERMAELIAEYFREDIFEVCEGITDTTKKIITELFNTAYKNGWGIDEIVKRLEDTELSANRARLIARTETVTAANKGAIFVAKDTGLDLNKTWLSAGDARVRYDHRNINGHTVGIDDYFVVGGYEMQQPGDRGGKDGKPAVDIKEIGNCRCCVIFRKVKD